MAFLALVFDLLNNLSQSQSSTESTHDVLRRVGGPRNHEHTGSGLSFQSANPLTKSGFVYNAGKALKATDTGSFSSSAHSKSTLKLTWCFGHVRKRWFSSQKHGGERAWKSLAPLADALQRILTSIDASEAMLSQLRNMSKTVLVDHSWMCFYTTQNGEYGDVMGQTKCRWTNRLNSPLQTASSPHHGQDENMRNSGCLTARTEH
eukprot:2180374-Amphidinium_carterae.1